MFEFTVTEEGAAMTCRGLRRLDLTCEVLLGGYGFVHLNELFADGGVDGYLLPQQFHLFVGHHFNVQVSDKV